MNYSEFENGFKMLCDAYGSKVFPPVRQQLMWNRYEQTSAREFRSAVDWIVLNLPQPGTIVHILDDRLFKKESRENIYRFKCEPCRDFGYGFIGDTIVACVCPQGLNISAQEIARQQENYDSGRKRFMDPKTAVPALMKELPYDPNERIQ